jgi:hypothetical protein
MVSKITEIESSKNLSDLISMLGIPNNSVSKSFIEQVKSKFIIKRKTENMKKEFISIKELKRGQLCICQCPEWCSLGLQIAEWDGKKFDYPDSLNDEFDLYVIAFMPIDVDGRPFVLEMSKYPQNI